MSEQNGIAQKAEQIYQSRWKKQLEADHLHEFVAIEPNSERYYLGKSISEAIENARAADPQNVTYVIRIGHAAAVEFAGG